MTSYTITITPDDDHATTTTLRLDASHDGVKLTDLNLHARSGLSTATPPAIDYRLLLQAITPTAATPVLTAPAKPVHHIASTATPHAEAVTVVRPDATTREATPKRKPGQRTTSKAAPAAAEPVKNSRTRRATATAKKTTTSGVSSGRTKTAKAAPARKATHTATPSGRAYRRMPEDLAAVYQQAGTASAVAEHYNVPRHTAHGWIRRLPQ
jgi:hypothetical protein